MTQAGIYKESVQDRWADLSLERRGRLFWRFSRRLEALFARLGLICVCMDCQRVLTYEQGCGPMPVLRTVQCGKSLRVLTMKRMRPD